MQKIKILGVNRDRNGSDWHRIFYNLNNINGLNIENSEIEVVFTEGENLMEEIKGFNILAYNWDCKLTVQQLSSLQKEGIKILYFIDDFWEFPIGHYNFFNGEAIKTRTKQHLLQADAVVCTTQDLVLKAIHYNDNVAIIPNFLNPKDFTIVDKKESDKLRLGLIGSASHIPNFLEFKNVLNKISKNKELCKKIEFVIGGYVKNAMWDSVIDMFKKKKNVNYKIIEYIPLDNYLDVYSEIDVCLLPLEIHDFNFCRSSLKLIECALTNTIPVGSPIYSKKEINKLVSCFSPLDWEESISLLTNEEYFKTILKNITEENLTNNKFEERFYNLLKVVNSVYREDLSPKFNTSMNLWTITYDDDQTPLYKAYNNNLIRTPKQKSWRFEWNPILDILSKEITEEYTGIFSYKFEQKTNLTKNILTKFLNKNSYENYDFINLSRGFWKTTKEYLEFSYKQHPQLESILKKVLHKLEKNYTYSDTYTYSNFFIMKTELYKEYVNNWVIPALNYMENEIWEEVNIDANYKGVGKEKLKELSGLEYYNNVTFVLERLILFFIESKKLNCLNVH